MNRYIQYMYSYPHKTAYRPLENVDLAGYADRLAGAGQSLYLHIPFCESKCGYCNLFSVTGMQEDFFEQYAEAVIRQIHQYSKILPKDAQFEDLTIGGGTPLLFPEHLLKKIFACIFEELPMKKDCEIIIETAPKQTSAEKIRMLKELGVTRVSMGIQSFQDEELKWLRRSHLAQSAREAAALLSAADLKCLNLDFIYGIPFQTKESLTASLEEAITYAPDEIFLYPLYIKHGVKLLEEQNVPDPEHTYRLYQCGVKVLKAHGYIQDSMRRFTRQEQRGFTECGLKSSLALGCGGRSYLGPLHVCTPYKITRCSAVEELRDFIQTKDHTIVKHGIILNEEEQRRRYVIRHAFTRQGISLLAYKKNFGRELFEEFKLFAEWMEKGYFGKEGDRIVLTETGIGLSDLLGPQLISKEIRARMEAWEREYE